MQTDIDCMLHRKHTHIAQIDVELIIAQKGSCELTIKVAFYDTKVNVNGKNVDGYFLSFEESGIKDMVLNSGNRKKIAKIIMEQKQCTAVESRNLKNWVGLKINLKIDPRVKYGGEITGGIVIDEDYQQKPKKTLDEACLAFNAVDSREAFVLAMQEFNEFMQNPDILSKCKELAVQFPKPVKND